MLFASPLGNFFYKIVPGRRDSANVVKNRLEDIKQHENVNKPRMWYNVKVSQL